MKSIFTNLFAIVCLTSLSLGCEPRPVAEEPAEPAVGVETTETQPVDDADGVDDQVGDGGGVQVEVGQ